MIEQQLLAESNRSATLKLIYYFLFSAEVLVGCEECRFFYSNVLIGAILISVILIVF